MRLHRESYGFTLLELLVTITLIPMWRGDPYAGTWNFVPKQRPFY